MMSGNWAHYGVGLVGIALLMTAAGPAWASGEYAFRTVTQSSIAACPSGHEVELYHEYGDAWSWDEEVAVACMTGKGLASWVLTSGTACDDEYSASGQRYCSGKEAAAAHVPALARDYGDTKKSSPPLTDKYQLLRWGLGHDCKIGQQVFGEDEAPDVSDTFYYWQCANLTFGSTFDSDTGPLVFHPHAIWTKSDKPLDVDQDDDPTAKLPLDFAFGADGRYTYRFR